MDQSADREDKLVSSVKKWIIILLIISVVNMIIKIVNTAVIGGSIFSIILVGLYWGVLACGFFGARNKNTTLLLVFIIIETIFLILSAIGLVLLIIGIGAAGAVCNSSAIDVSCDLGYSEGAFYAISILSLLSGVIVWILSVMAVVAASRLRRFLHDYQGHSHVTTTTTTSVGYGQPQPGVGYQQPPPGVGYGAPQPQPGVGYGAPQPQPGYGAPQPAVGYQQPPKV